MITVKSRHIYKERAYWAAINACKRGPANGYTLSTNFEDGNTRIKFLQYIQKAYPFEDVADHLKGKCYQLWCEQRDIALRLYYPNFFPREKWGQRYEQLELWR